jgi:hypothetical protein
MITYHTRERLSNRLKDIATREDWQAMIEASDHFTQGKHYVKVRNLGSTHYLDDSVGDTLVCIILDGEVKTAMLSFSSQTWHDGETWRLR